MKKLIALLLCMVMVASLFAACGGETAPVDTTPVDSNTTPVDSTPDVTDPPVPTMAPSEDLPGAPLYYWDFETTDGLSAVVQGEKAADSVNDGATFDIVPSDHAILTTDGVVGKSLYLDGTYGIKLDTLAALDNDSYTVSFWVNADRLSTYGPVVQMGRNIGRADTGDATVTWLNFTQAEWGTASAKMFPLVWNRNSSTGVWPWISAGDDAVHGKREWCHVSIVVDGNRYTCADDGLDRIGTFFYINGVLAFGAPAENAWYQGVSPEILMGDGVEGYIGINYWDTMFKGYIDELSIYDEALTAGQVANLYLQGDPTMTPVAPETDGPEVTEPAPIVPVTDIVPAEGALEVLGTTDLTLAWWTENTSGYEIADGATVTFKLNNYSNGEANWKNYVMAFTTVPTELGKLAGADNYPDYAEYAVIRADSYGWGDASYNAVFENSWTDWTEWLRLMTDAEVTIAVTRNGGELVMDTTFVGADGTTMTCHAVVTTTLTAEAPCYAFIGGEGAYIELLSVE